MSKNKDKIVRIEADRLAGKGLMELPPRAAKKRGNPRRILGGSEKQRAAQLYRGDIVTAVYESESAKVEIENNMYDEFVHVLEGRLILTDTQGKVEEFAPGDSCIMPKGFNGTWEMIGEPLFRELVVIETKTFDEDATAP